MINKGKMYTMQMLNKESWRSLQISDTIDFEIQWNIGGKEDHYMVIKCSFHEKIF